MKSRDTIRIRGARLHNLKNIDVDLPKHQIVAITGVSGSGKSSLAFDLLFEEGRARYLQAIGMPPRVESDKPFDEISGLSPTIAVEQRTLRYRTPRSTVGTRTGLYNYLRMLYAAEGHQLCPICADPVGADLACPTCGLVVDRLEIKHFSFNEPSGMCLTCHGRGYTREFRQDKIVFNEDLSLHELCADPLARGSFGDMKNWMPGLAEHYEFDLATPYGELAPEIQEVFLHGSGGKKLQFHWKSKRFDGIIEKEYEGIIPHLQRAMKETTSDYRRRKIEKNFMDKVACPECAGYRVNARARATRLGGKHVGELANLTIDQLADHLETLPARAIQTATGRALRAKILRGLERFRLVGLAYLHLNRATRSLSGGEQQRLSLMSQMSVGLSNVVLILDEPTMGMHELEKASLGRILEELRDAGNSVIIVEHDETLMQLADEVIDLGPGPGVQGGTIVAQGVVDAVKQVEASLTGHYLTRTLRYPEKGAGERRPGDATFAITLRDVGTNNLQDVTVALPLGVMVGVAGVSGSGKSSLVTDTLVPLLQKQLTYARNQKRATRKSRKNQNGADEEEYSDPLEVIKGKLAGWEHVDRVIVVSQAPIGRNRTSCPVTYIGLWDKIRRLFAKQPAAKRNKFKPGHFSFNSDKGRCPKCKGEGRIAVPLSFLDELSLPCEECHGSRYLPEILAVTFRGKNIREVLDLSVTEALEVFRGQGSIVKYLQVLEDIGMGYMTLGQPATTLSGGEAQRVKLAKAIGRTRGSRTRSGHVLFVLDEPTTGLHFHDEVKLLHMLDEIVEEGNSVVLIEHNPKVLRYCDYLVELGPGGGPEGGQVIATGTPEALQETESSQIGPYLASAGSPASAGDEGDA